MNLNSNTWRSPVTPESLMQLGKQAALSAETTRSSLTDSVVRAIGMTKLNEEQVRRVVEAANHEAYNRKFASMDASMRVVELEGGPADPAAVIDRLKIAATPVQVAAMSDYSVPPMSKAASVSQTAGITNDTMLKVASQDIRVLHERLKAAHEELVGEVGARSSHVHGSVQKLASLVKQAVAEGAYYEDFERAWGGISPQHTTEMLAAFAPPRAPEGVKTASRQISEGHPLLVAFSTFVKHAHEYEVACEAVRTVEAELVQVDSFYRSNFR